MNGDGIDDYGAGAPEATIFVMQPHAGRAYAWSGQDGSVIWSRVGSSGDRLGRGICGPGDVDGDGLADIAVSEPLWGTTASGEEGRVRVFRGGPAGSSFPVIHTITETAHYEHVGWSLVAIGDVDRDGVGDIAYSAPRSAKNGRAWVRSGATGQLLHFFDGGGLRSELDYGSVVAGRRGPHADHRQELLVGAPAYIPTTFANGTVAVILMPIGDSTSLGAGCGSSGQNQPSIDIGPSKLAQLMSIGTRDVPPTASPVILLGSDPTSMTIPLGFGCTIYLDLLTATTLAVLPINSSLTMLVPGDRNLAGYTMYFQGIAFDNNAPMSLVLTSGQLVTFGF